MSYATQADMIARYGEAELVQLTDRLNTPPVLVDAAVLAFALDSADAEIDGYLAVKFAVPLATPPRLIVDYACDIARYRLFADRASDLIRARYKDAIAFLDRVAKGTATIAGAQALSAPAGGGSVQFEAGQKVFGRELLGDER